MTKQNANTRQRLFRALLLGIVAGAIMAYFWQGTATRYDRDESFWRCWSLDEYSLNSTLGLKKNAQCRLRDVPGDIDARQQAFIDTAAQRIRPYVGDPLRTYDVRLYTYCRFGRGWPWHTLVYSATIVIDATGGGHPPSRDILFADKDGLSPERPLGLVFNGLFFFICASLVFWFADKQVRQLRGVLVAGCEANADRYLTERKRYRGRNLIKLAALAGLLATGYTSVEVRRQTPLSFVTTGSQFTLNSAVGLSNDYFPKERDPLSGAVNVNNELYEFCRRVAEDAKPLIPRSHTKRAQLLLIIEDRRSHGWPLTTYETAARVLIQDQPSGTAMKQWEDYKVDASGGSPYQWLAMLGNWLIYSALAMPLLWLGERVLAELLRRLTRRQRAFPVIITDEQERQNTPD